LFFAETLGGYAALLLGFGWVVLGAASSQRFRVGRVVANVQNKSPCPAASAPFSCRVKTVHSHSGYSSSANATGSCLSFKKFKPLRGVPAGTELRTSGVAFFSAAAAASFFRAGGGAGVVFSLKG